MTAQLHDLFTLDATDHAVVGVNGTGLFEPTRYGLHPVGTCSACWRGYRCRYAVAAGKLVLAELSLSLGHGFGGDFVPERGPELKGVIPIPPRDERSFFNNFYEYLTLPVDFTGGMLIADGFIDELYVHMGFHPAWKYQRVIELIFERGSLFEERDVSDRVAAMRSELARLPEGPGPDASRDEMQQWIEATFRLEYDL